MKSKQEEQLFANEASEQYHRFIRLLNTNRTSYNELRRAWSNPNLTDYCIKNISLQSEYNRISAILWDNQTKKPDILEEFEKGAGQVLQEHFANKTPVPQSNLKRPATNDNRNHEAQTDNEHKKLKHEKQAIEQIPQQNANIDNLQTELTHLKTEKEKLQAELAQQKNAHENNIVSLKDLHKGQITFFHSDKNDLNNKLNTAKQTNEVLTNNLAQQKVAADTLLQQEKSKREATEIKYLTLETQIQKVAQYTERKICFTDKAFDELRGQVQHFCEFVKNKNTPMALQLWDNNRLLKLFLCGYAFSAPSNNYFNMHKESLIKCIKNIVILPQLFPIFCEIIEYNPDLYNFMFGTLEIFGRDNSQQTTLNTYRLENNTDIIFNLFNMLQLQPANDSKVLRISNYIINSQNLINLIKTNISSFDFKPVEKTIYYILPELAPEVDVSQYFTF